MPLLNLRARSAFISLFIALTAAATSALAAEVGIPNPLIRQRADPFVLHHVDGFYYFMGTVPEYDRLELRRASTIEGLASAEAKTIWRRHPTGEMGSHIWAPELHFIDGRWFIYFAAGSVVHYAIGIHRDHQPGDVESAGV